jgi:hypothetical protein
MLLRMLPLMFQKGGCFHPFGCAVNDNKNIIKTTAILIRSHQVNVKERKTSLRDGDGFWR